MKVAGIVVSLVQIGKLSYVIWEVLLGNMGKKREGDPELFESGALAAIGSEFGDLGEFERHAITVAEMDPEQATVAVAARLKDGALDL